MSLKLELTPFAKSNLVDIVVWTVENFGTAQADKYEDMLIERCLGLTDGTTPSRDCASLEEGLSASGLLFARAQRHYVIFTKTADRIVVLDFVHVASDLIARVGALKNNPMT